MFTFKTKLYREGFATGDSCGKPFFLYMTNSFPSVQYVEASLFVVKSIAIHKLLEEYNSVETDFVYTQEIESVYKENLIDSYYDYTLTLKEDYPDMFLILREALVTIDAVNFLYSEEGKCAK